ncbi:MAG: NAD-dependent epimerase/dehydratase family protein [Roseiflexaceae bacterium]
MIKFLVTGATGFIGARVVANLQQRHIPVVAADYRPDAAVVAKLDHERPDGAETLYVSFDVSDSRQVEAIFQEHAGITHCIHLAYLMSAEVEADQRRGAEVNIVGMANMFDAAARHRLRRLVFASSETVYGASQALYGEADHAVAEDEYCGPRDHFFTYGVMKILNEFVASKYVQKHGISIACLRPPVVFGHGRKRGAVLWSEHIASYPALGKPVTLPFPPATHDCWIYKDDCAEQFVRLALKPSIGHLAYNTGGETVSAARLAELIQRWLPEADIRFEPHRPPTPLVDNISGERLEREIDFRPRPLAEGIRLHINEARAEAGFPPI